MHNLKPYFAKYLPVEGEIKEGDYIDTLGGVIQKLHKGEIPFPFSKKHKLFLCSRDIQVGDKVERFESDSYWGEYHKGKEVREIKPTAKGSLDNGESLLILLGGGGEVVGNWFYMREFFKVIGEISPEAIWVKEGDEFEDIEINKYAQVWDTRVGYREFVQIRCPTCKNFH